ncbi:MAG: VWA domain-containing protein [Vicinamibacterales bacterium]
MRASLATAVMMIALQAGGFAARAAVGAPRAAGDALRASTCRPDEASERDRFGARRKKHDQQKPDQQVPRIREETRVDIVLVDVNVVDGNGKPVEGLGAADFEVSIDGRPRTIQTVQYITQAPGPGAAEPAGEAPRVSSNEEVARGRLFMVVVDEANISTGDARALDEPLEKFFSSLGPRDRVGLTTIPLGGPRIDFTSDSKRVRRALEGITGMTQTRSLSRYSIGLAEAFAFENLSPEWGEVVARECAGLSGEAYQVCKMDVEADARTMIVDTRYRANASLGGLYDTVRSLRAVEGPKTVVFVSGGIVIERDDAMSFAVASEAAAADTTIFVMHLERPLVDAGVARPSPTLFQDQELGRRGLEFVAGRARGEVFRVATSTEFAFARIAAETSGYYLLGVDAEPSDRDGKTHQVRVELASSRRGMTLRSRREFRYDVVAADGATDEQRLGELLGAPTTVNEIPIRASAYTMGDPSRGKLQVHVAAEIGQGATAEETMVVGFVLTDQSGRPRASAGQRLALQPVDPRAPSPLRYTGRAWIEPGDYTLKLAVVQPGGLRGSIEHPVRVRLTRAGPLQAADLFVLDAPGSGSIEFRPEVVTRLTGQRVAAFCELYAEGPKAFEQAGITFEIAASEDGPALIGGTARPAGTEPTRRMVQLAMSTSMLPPGDYFARIILTDGGNETARLLRAFRVERRPVAGGAAGAGGAPGATSGTPAIGAESVVPKPVFRREALLEPDALWPFLNQLGKPSSPIVAAALDDAREGRFDAILESPPPAMPDMAMSFVRGLALYARGGQANLNEALAAFREASGFFPATFYIGACFAAAGMDTEAAGAWQTSLVTQENVPIVYEMLSDALMRLGRYSEANDILEEAAARFQGLESLEPRRAAASLGMGDAQGAFRRVASFIDRHPDDLDAMFLALRLLYEAVADEKWIAGREEDRARLLEYARKYSEAGGPHDALVQQWVKAVGKRD